MGIFHDIFTGLVLVGICMLFAILLNINLWWGVLTGVIIQLLISLLNSRFVKRY